MATNSNPQNFSFPLFWGVKCKATTKDCWNKADAGEHSEIAPGGKTF